MLLVNTKEGKLIDDDTLKEYYASRKPYGEWIDKNLVSLKKLQIPNKGVLEYSKDEIARLQKAFGYSYEDIKTSILPMAKNGSEPTAAMGIDSPLAVLSKKHQPLFNYFKQLFAQVTNPPIDAIRRNCNFNISLFRGRWKSPRRKRRKL